MWCSRIVSGSVELMRVCAFDNIEEGSLMLVVARLGIILFSADYCTLSYRKHSSPSPYIMQCSFFNACDPSKQR